VRAVVFTPLVARRAWADRRLLVVSALVVTLTVAVADAVPRRLEQTADAAVAAAAATAGPLGDVLVRAPFDDVMYLGELPSGTDITVVEPAARMAAALPPELAAVLGDPVAVVQGVSMPLTVPVEVGVATLSMAYVWSAEGPGVDWIAGGPPAATVTARDVEAAPYRTDWPIQVALSQDVAARIGVGVGDALSVQGSFTALDIRVSGVFRARESDDAAWLDVPGLLTPHVIGSVRTRTTEFAALLSPDSLAAVELNLTPEQLDRTFRFPLDRTALDGRNYAAVGAAAAGLEAAPGGLGGPGPRPSVSTGLDTVLARVGERIDAAAAQASVLLAGLVVAGGAVLAATAALLVRRRRGALGRLRARGASLPTVAVQSLLEAMVVAAAGGALGLALGRVAVGGQPSWTWVLPVVAVAVLVGPAASTVAAAGALRVARAPTDRRLRHVEARVAAIRRAAVEVALVVVAGGALVALRRRGVVAMTGTADLLLAAAPALCALTVGVLVWHVRPLLLRWTLWATRRSSRAVPFLAAARAQVGGAMLPFVCLVLVTGLWASAAALGTTMRSGLVAGSWDSVGADVVVGTEPDDALAANAEQVAHADGVLAATVGRAEGAVQVFGSPDVTYVQVLAVDPAGFADLLAATPIGPVPQVAGLATADGKGGLPALVSGPLSRDAGAGLSVLWDGVTVPITPVGEAPALPTASALVSGVRKAVSAAPLLVVDRQALAAAVGAAVDPDTLWVAGPGADTAVATAELGPGAALVSRADWLAERRADPLTAGLDGLVSLSLAVLAALAVLVTVLGVASEAPGRGSGLAALRVLGLDRGRTWQVALGEVAPPVVLGAAAGLGVGLALVPAVSGALALRLVTGQVADPLVVVPGWVGASAALVLLTVLVAVAVESSARRRERLGQVLRVS